MRGLRGLRARGKARRSESGGVGPGRIEEFLLGRAAEEPRARAGPLAAGFIGIGSLVVLGTIWLLPPDVDRRTYVILSLGGLATSVVTMMLPWSRWPAWTLVAPPCASYVLLAAGGLVEPDVLQYYIPLYTLSFVYLGLVTAPGVPSLMVPASTASYLIGNSSDLGPGLASLAIAVPLWLLVGEVLARLLQQARARADAERTIRRFGDRVHAHLDLQMLLDTAVREIADAVDADRVFVRLFDEHQNAWTAAEWDAPGVESIDRVIPAGTPASFRPLVERAFRDGEIVVVNDAEHDDGVGADALETLERLRCKVLIFRPLTEVADHDVGPDRRGMLVLHRVTDRAWRASEVDVIDSISTALTTAIGHARAYALQREMVKRLRELDQAKTDFVSSVSHELRTPLTSITGYLELLVDGDAGEVNPEQARMLEIAERNSHRLLALIEELLTLSRIEAGTFRLEVTEVDVAALVDRVREAIAPGVAERRINLAVDVPAGIGTVTGDAGQLERALLNLASNAVKFTPPGGEVAISARRLGEGVQLRVRDTGMGIPLDEQRHLFTRFFRSSLSQERAVEGTGLGLSIVKAIVDQHGGTIEVDSTPGAGSTFTVMLRAAATDRRPSERVSA